MLSESVAFLLIISLMQPRYVIELLAPAKNAQCARAAVDHGADAVYIGAPAFGARKSAANSMDDIRETVRYAHAFGVRIYVTLNTLLFDDEVPAAVELAWQLYELGVDALIIQDFGLLEAGLPPIELHASTQMDNRTAQKVAFLQDVGFEQVVLARELSRQQIADIARQSSVRLECFVHGALCVSYSGQCYMSQCINGRSANRGECGQPCRLAYNLKDANGQILERNKHLLSLKDFNQTDNLEALMDAGVSSFKIEGRLKDVDYVSNITLHYRQKIDEILVRRPQYVRASSGRVVPAFSPKPEKSFNRGFTTYFFEGRQRNINQLVTPKSFGEYLGRAENCNRDSFCIKGNPTVSNGDGLCFIAPNGEFNGLKVNKVDNQRIFPRYMHGLRDGAEVYRNSDVAFDALMRSDSTRRVIELSMQLTVNQGNIYRLELSDADGVHTVLERSLTVVAANNPASVKAYLERQLSKLGGTIFECPRPVVSDAAAQLFVPTAELNAFRRDAAEAHLQNRLKHYVPEEHHFTHNVVPYVATHLDAAANVINEYARRFFARHGATVESWGYERLTDYKGRIVMTTRHCVLHSIGCCLRENPNARPTLPLTLENEHDKYQLSFDCHRCEMQVRKV